MKSKEPGAISAPGLTLPLFKKWRPYSAPHNADLLFELLNSDFMFGHVKFKLIYFNAMCRDP